MAVVNWKELQKASKEDIQKVIDELTGERQTVKSGVYRKIIFQTIKQLERLKQSR